MLNSSKILTSIRHPDLSSHVAPDHICSRFNIEKITALYGKELISLSHYLLIGDPLADQLVKVLYEMPQGTGGRLLNTAIEHGVDNIKSPPKELREYFENIYSIPAWLSWKKIENAGDFALKHAGILSLVLRYVGLTGIFSIPGANRTFYYSKNLLQRTSRRISETGYFVLKTHDKGGLEKNSEGFKICLKVRLMHAQVRRLLLRRSDWQVLDWGIPINQFDMFATSIFLSIAAIRYLRKLGIYIDEDEADNYIHLWLYISYLLGVHPDLLEFISSRKYETVDIGMASIHKPDEIGIKLVDSLFQVIKTQYKNYPHFLREPYINFLYDLTRFLIGDEYADNLLFPKSKALFVRYPFKYINNIISRIETLLPNKFNSYLYKKKKDFLLRHIMKELSSEIPKYQYDHYDKKSKG